MTIQFYANVLDTEAEENKIKATFFPYSSRSKVNICVFPIMDDGHRFGFD